MVKKRKLGLKSTFFFNDVQLQLSAFTPHNSSPPPACPLPSLASTPPWFCPCVLYSSSHKPLSSLSPPHSPLAIVRLFLTSMSLVIFCLLFSSIDYVPVKGEIIPKEPVHPNVHSSTIYNSQVLEAT